MVEKTNRRDFLIGGVTGLTATRLAHSLATGRGEMPCRPLGKTGERVSLVSLGGWHIGFDGLSEPESFRIIPRSC